MFPRAGWGALQSLAMRPGRRHRYSGHDVARTSGVTPIAIHIEQANCPREPDRRHATAVVYVVPPVQVLCGRHAFKSVLGVNSLQTLSAI